jgi:hypothetical protein
MIRTFCFSLLVLAGSVSGVHAVTADQMTCAEAIAYFERNGSIQIIANRRDVITLRPGIPVNQARNLYCTGRGAAPRGYMVKTRDANRCVIAMRCR